MNTRTSTLTADLLFPGRSPNVLSALGLPPALSELRRFSRDRQHRRLLRSRAPLALGSPSAPWQPTAAGRDEARALFAALATAAPRTLRITTASPAVLDHRAELRELDHRHALAIDLLLVSAAAPLSAGRAHLETHHRALLRAARGLAEQGLLVRLVLAGSGERRASREDLRTLFAAARAAEVEDVVTPRERADEGLQRLLDRLRLEHGFPRGLPGRG